MENIAPLRDAHRIVMVMDNAKQTMHWSGSACASQDGMEQDAIFIWNKTAQIVKIMTKVRPTLEHTDLVSKICQDLKSKRHYQLSSLYLQPKTY